MSWFTLFRSKPRNTADLARQRLQIIVAQARAERGGPDYLPMLKRELLEVIRKYVHVAPDAVEVNLSNEGEHEVLEMNIVLPDREAGDID
ncbi:MAG: cell division topological specificity factor MinE [Xanthomonadales bacterium]|nr:cell division topological specificity factor MinE [Xanthomonadales bacterium]